MSDELNVLAHIASALTPALAAVATSAQGGTEAQGELLRFSLWLLCCLVRVYFLIGFRNRFPVALNWSRDYIKFQHGLRLISGISGSRTSRL
jgi:NADH:ubiquinone reductase (H+-translocating)